MNYKETLMHCYKNNIDIYDAMVANEVDFQFNGGEGAELGEFEQLCDLVAEAYVKVDTTTSLSQVVDSLRNLVVDKGKDINTITRLDIIRNINYSC